MYYLDKKAPIKLWKSFGSGYGCIVWTRKSPLNFENLSDPDSGPETLLFTNHFYMLYINQFVKVKIKIAPHTSFEFCPSPSFVVAPMRSPLSDYW